MTEKVTIELSEADLAELRAWAANSEQILEELLQDAVQAHITRTREWIASIREAEKGPFYSLDEVQARVAERRGRWRSDAAE